MKKKLFTIISIILIFLSQSNAIAQSEAASQDCTGGLSSSIDEQTATARIDLFTHVKHSIIMGAGAIVNDYFTIPRDTIVKVLQYLNTASYNYDGARVYFAYAGHGGGTPILDRSKFILILMPTTQSTATDDEGDVKSIDDSTHTYIIHSDGTIEQKNISNGSSGHYIASWMGRYLKFIVPTIQSTFKNRFDINFSEAHSLWYSKDVLFYGGKDLLTYLNNCTDVTQVIIHFASWTYDLDQIELSFKMDLIFELVSSNKELKKRFFTLGSMEIMNNLKNKKGVEAASDYANTGLPCPPNKCP